jgi:hypothetical protein
VAVASTGAAPQFFLKSSNIRQNASLTMYRLDLILMERQRGETIQNVPFYPDDVIMNADLRSRPTKLSDYKAETDALIVLLQSMPDVQRLFCFPEGTCHVREKS